MAVVLRSLYFLLFLSVPNIPLAIAQGENQFVYSGFRQAKLQLDGTAKIQANGLLQLTNFLKVKSDHAFYRLPIKFRTSLSFSTNFVFAMVPEMHKFGGHGIVFTISPSSDFTHALASHYLELFNRSNNGLPTNHILAIEIDTVLTQEFGDINGNHVGIDVNNLRPIESVPSMYFSYKGGKNISLGPASGNPTHLWIDYNDGEKLLNVTIAPRKIPKPTRPVLSKSIDLSEVLIGFMYVGFSSATGSLTASGLAQSLEVSSLPSLPRGGKRKGKPLVLILTLLIAGMVVLITIPGATYIFLRKKSEEVREDWEEGYGPQRFTYKDLHNATRGFKDTTWGWRFWKCLERNASIA